MTQEQNLYLLLDSRGTALAQVKIEGSPSGDLWQLRVLDDRIDGVLTHKKFKLMSITDSSPSYEGTLERSRGEQIQLRVKKTAANGNDMRKNLRVPVHFNSFIYPLTGGWKGRREVESNDLSCGGIAFFTNDPFKLRERFEMVIPITTQPVILRCEVLRQRPCAQEGRDMYAAKFVEMCHDEEMLVREAVFNVQLSTRSRRTEENNT